MKVQYFVKILLQSLFTWIFYLFNYWNISWGNKKIASILIHLDFLSIWSSAWSRSRNNKSFNPYSPGFSIYLRNSFTRRNGKNSFNPYSPGFSIYLDFARFILGKVLTLQSLFTWIFYLFHYECLWLCCPFEASILIHLDFLSI